MSYEVCFISGWDDDDKKNYMLEYLSKEELDENLMEDRTTLFIIKDGKVSGSYYDRGEPEDNSFCRDWSWILNELKAAYEKGKQDMAAA